MHRYKSFTTTKYRKSVEQLNWVPFPGKLWQRNYFEHVIRNEDELNRIREYIMYNPSQWIEDENNPVNIKNRFSPM
jgi:REP element-mobilizing transposase RayT